MQFRFPVLISMLVLLFFQTAFVNASDRKETLQFTEDTIPRIEYIGYRLYLTQFEVGKTKKGFQHITLSAINTGNKKMQLGKGAAQIFPVVSFDPSLEASGLADAKAAIYFQLLEEKITIPIGAIYTKIELKLPLAAEENLATKNTGKKPKETEPETTPTAEPDKPEPIVTETLSADSNSTIAHSPETTSKSGQDQMAEAVETVDEVVVEETVLEEEEEEEEEVCSDLVLKNINILKRSKNSIQIEYQLVNQGFGRAPLIIGKKKDQQSLAIRASLSSGEKLTRGSLVINSTFLHGEEISLAGGESYTGKLKIELHKLTKFTPYLILEMDAFEFVSECDESNNAVPIKLLEEEE